MKIHNFYKLTLTYYNGEYEYTDTMFYKFDAPLTDEEAHDKLTEEYQPREEWEIVDVSLQRADISHISVLQHYQLVYTYHNDTTKVHNPPVTV